MRDVPLDPGRSYFDARSPLRVRRRITRSLVKTSVVVTAVISVMVALFLADWRFLPLTAAAVGLLSLAMYRLLHRVPRTTVYCRRCPGSGWIDDLREHDGACPHCGNARFDYRGVRYTGVSISMPLSSDDVSGAWLLEQQRYGRYRHHFR